MGGAAAIISTITSMASVFANRQRRSDDNSASKAVARREAQERARMRERRDRDVARREDARERERLQQKKRGEVKSTIATGGAGLLGQADVGKTGLKATLGE